MKLLQIALVAGLLAATAAVEARQPASPQPSTPSAPRATQLPAGPQQQPPVVIVDTRDARQTRERLREVLDQYPPSVREVLRLDPTLLSRADYMSTYPVLAAFLGDHPEVAHNPAFFIGLPGPREDANTPQHEALRTVRNVLQMFVVAIIVMTITTGVILLARTLADYRRWLRASRAQTDLHMKLIDRFAVSEELLAYLQSPQGRMLIESPSPTQGLGRGMDAPLGRIFWSLQAGAVLICAGIGLLFVSGQLGDTLDVVEPAVFAFGTVILTIGIGFFVSAAISYFLSQRLGLVRPLSTSNGEAPGS